MLLPLPASHPSRPHFTILQKIQQTDLLLPIFSISIPVWSLSMGFGLSFAKLYILAAQTPNSCSVPCFPILGNGFSLRHKSLTNICAQDCTEKKTKQAFFFFKIFIFYYVHVLWFVRGNKDVWRAEEGVRNLEDEWQAVLSCPVWVLGTECGSPHPHPGESSQCS